MGIHIMVDVQVIFLQKFTAAIIITDVHPVQAIWIVGTRIKVKGIDFSDLNVVLLLPDGRVEQTRTTSAAQAKTDVATIIVRSNEVDIGGRGC